MAFDYLPVDRDQQFLLPPSLREWLPEGHLVWFVLDVVARVDTSRLHARHPRDGVGRRAFDPDMLLALLVYSYCMGQRSSRQIERLCEVDVAYRVICANVGPDHTTIARFRQTYQDEAVQLFTDVLVMCAECGLVRVGVVAVDGTKMGGAASLKANRSRAQIEAEVAKMMSEAATVDAGEDDLFGGDRGDGMPVELADPRTRRARLDAALIELERARKARLVEEQRVIALEAEAAQAGRLLKGRVPPGREVERAEAALERHQERVRARRERIERDAAAQGRKPGGPPPGKGPRVARFEERLARARAAHTGRNQQQPPSAGNEARVNVTDLDSRVMRNAQGWVQGFNAQAAANEAGIVIAGDVTQQANDSLQCQPMIAATLASLNAAGIAEPVGVMLFDAGYISDANLKAAGPDRLIATGKAHTLRKSTPTSGEAPPGSSATAAMEHRLRTPDGAALYKKRQHTIEPVFATVKDTRGYRRFTRRGLAAVKAEWLLILATHNINKAYTHG
jgi:transposase